MGFRKATLQHVLLGSVAVVGLAATAIPAYASDAVVNYNIPPQSLAPALKDFGLQNGMTIIADAEIVRGKVTQGAKGQADPETALRMLLKGTGLTYRRNGNVFAVRIAGNGSQADAAVADPQAPEAGDIIVTAQKRRESIQSVPIAVSAFSAQSLNEQKIEGGSELMRAVPNVTFSKSNFASYNFSIRGIGTKALSVTSDPGVAVSFNNTPLIRNRLFEQEYFDVQRVEVLRGPQGTLYGRNATAGVVNMFPNFADPDRLAAEFKLETGNYKSMRATGMVNLPITDTLAVRVAGAWTSRNGYDFNTVTQRDVNGRNLWGTRLTASWEPSNRFRLTAAWEHFNEDDDRSRTGKQLCHNDPGPTAIGSADISELAKTRAELSQGCTNGSLYDDGAYGVPNGLSLPFILAAADSLPLGFTPSFDNVSAVKRADPFAGVTQSRNLREIATSYDPRFKAKNDVFQLNAELEIAPSIRLYSQSAYSKDSYFSSQDYNRFQSNDIFGNSAGLLNVLLQPLPGPGMTPGGVFSDPQLGASTKMIGVDMVRSNSDQWYQEFRLQSSFDGPLNFSVGANYLKFKIDEDYYVFNNVFTLLATGLFNSSDSGITQRPCAAPTDECVYIDPNPLNAINGDGHNYFRSRNIAKTESLAGFGELYWKATDRLKFTLGLRYTDDKKTATPVPTQLLLGPGVVAAGIINRGYVQLPDIVQKWGRVTGRFVVDWKPRLGFTEDTLIYVSYSRGYKGGGANPPGIGADPTRLQFFPNPSTFRPETVDAFEVGMKNSFDGGRLTLNASAFYYKYKDYQVSQIVDRMALNENFDAKIWGAELEAAWRPTSRLRLNANLGYLGTRIDDGMQSIDVMNRTQGNPDWMTLKPYLQLSSNCIAPKSVIESILKSPFYGDQTYFLFSLCGSNQWGSYAPGSITGLFMNGLVYDPATDAPNSGRGFYANLGGNELPNSPHWTANLGAQYTLPIVDWNLTVRGDYYRQGESWARLYNTTIDRLRSWDNANVSITLDRPESGFAMQLYVKNVFNKTPITDAFINSDDSGLTTNVFTLDPRIIGFNVTKRF